MSHLTDKKILLGVTGGIAAYKAADLVRRLIERGAQVKVVMTQGATAFVTPLTFQALSGQRVHTTLLDEAAEAAMGHIELARWADLILIAPASADFIAKLTHGHADDLLSTLCLASTAPIAVTPAMNQAMWAAAATQANVQTLQQRGVLFYGPAEGEQACGDVGAGRMLEPLQIVDHVINTFQQSDQLQGRTIVVTAGATREDIDPVRFITNRSSGKMGYAVAAAAQKAGAKVILVSGQVNLPVPAGVKHLSAYSAQTMLEAVLGVIDKADIFISTAAVADYRPRQMATQKIKKNNEEMSIELERTTDILATVAALDKPPFTVGFAAETNDVEAYARGKLKRKNLNMIAANQVGIEGAGFDSNDNALTVYWQEGEQALPHCSKTELAHHLMDLVIQRFNDYANR